MNPESQKGGTLSRAEDKVPAGQCGRHAAATTAMGLPWLRGFDLSGGLVGSRRFWLPFSETRELHFEREDFSTTSRSPQKLDLSLLIGHSHHSRDRCTHFQPTTTPGGPEHAEG